MECSWTCEPYAIARPNADGVVAMKEVPYPEL